MNANQRQNTEVQKLETGSATILIWSHVGDKNIPKQKRERAEVDARLSEHFKQTISVIRNEAGAPSLPEDLQLYISISHSNPWFAVALSTKPIGIDIQVPKSRMIAGRRYFMNEREAHWKTEKEHLIVWCAKEAIYKKYGGQIKDLREEVTAVSIEYGSIVHLSYAGRSEQFFVNHFDAYCLVWG